MISVKNVLELPALRTLRIIGGHNGLDNRVGYVTVMEVPDITKWLRGNDFLITSLYSVRNDVGLQCQLIEKLSKSSCSCIAIKTGQYVKEIADELVKTADACKIPLLEIPYDVHYNDIIICVMTAILEDKDVNIVIEKYLKDIIFDNYNDENLMIERGRLLGVLVEGSFYTSMNFSFPSGFEPSREESDSLVRVGKALAQYAAKQSEISPNGMISMKNDISIIFKACSAEAVLKGLFFIEKEAEKQLEYYLKDIDVKIGYGTIEKNIKGIKYTYFNALKAVRTGYLFRPREKVYNYEDIEMYCVLNNLFKEDTKEFSEKILKPVTNKELLSTLNTYYECNASIEKTADSLYVHKNTIKYRLERIHEITGLDIKDNNDNFKLHLAVLIDKINRNNKEL
ncbi:purine catabolism regulator [Ruminiclostridium sufflavum DSM 19573]|uniref:Purine catabolism regulator n=1 Tax=Ruminiclostridium sufflavum DSM 19573 TaxID=1121337 RepID=A0A318XS16_9FIRM|nr:PucR family transcriptional regulator [Ruminiclostridium sufflavum]PYG90314.1 purine catabolism regulator [Ruminiclostridium sufflavum DSM 19573]